jgi:hypothetical protein
MHSGSTHEESPSPLVRIGSSDRRDAVRVRAGQAGAEAMHEVPADNAGASRFRGEGSDSDRKVCVIAGPLWNRR